MARHVSSSEYKYIPLDNVLKIAELEEIIRKKDKQIRTLIKKTLRSKNDKRRV